MSSKLKITLKDYHKVLRSYFLCKGPKPLPRNWRQRLLLFYSAIRRFEVGLPYTEQEVNDILQDWQTRYAGSVEIDHVTLQRFLVDLGFLDRNPSGSVYAVIHGFLDQADWDSRILDTDEEALLEELRLAAPEPRAEPRVSRILRDDATISSICRKDSEQL